MYTSQSQKLQRNKHYMNTYRNKEKQGNIANWCTWYFIFKDKR